MINLTEEHKKLILRCFNISVEAGTVAYILEIDIKIIEECYSKFHDHMEVNASKLWAENFWDMYKIL